MPTSVLAATASPAKPRSKRWAPIARPNRPEGSLRVGKAAPARSRTGTPRTRRRARSQTLRAVGLASTAWLVGGAQPRTGEIDGTSYGAGRGVRIAGAVSDRRGRCSFRTRCPSRDGIARPPAAGRAETRARGCVPAGEVPATVGRVTCTAATVGAGRGAGVAVRTRAAGRAAGRALAWGDVFLTGAAGIGSGFGTGAGSVSGGGTVVTGPVTAAPCAGDPSISPTDAARPRQNAQKSAQSRR